MKKIAIIVLAAVLIAGGWFVLLRPANLTQEEVTESFLSTEESFITAAKYLCDNNVSAYVKRPKHGEPAAPDEKAAAAFENIFDADFDAIASTGSEVIFRYRSSGGLLNRIKADVIYNGKENVEDKPTVRLNENGWHLYIYQG